MGNYLEYRKKALVEFEKIDYPKWKRVRLKRYPKPILEDDEIKVKIESDLELKDLEQLSKEQLEVFYQQINEKKYGVDDKFLRLSESQSNFAKFYYLKRNQVIDRPIRLQFDLTDISTLADEHLIFAESGAEATIILEYHADEKVSQEQLEHHIGLIKVMAEENAQIKVYVIQTLPIHKMHVMNAVAICQRDAKVSFYTVDFGSDIIVSDYRSYLMGSNSEADIEGVYLGQAENKLDLSCNVQHYAPDTNSLIEVNGALTENARKVFRGDLYFHRGSSASTGSEAEYVILMSKEVKADSIPALFCDEDDVSGEHAMNAGRVDENKLFYLMNRGFSEVEAKKLIVRASFSKVLDHLPLEELTNQLESDLERKLVNV